MDISTDALIAISIIWGFVFIYAVMATMDFGAGFWSMIYLNKEHMKATDIANRFLSPTWEVTNVFIVAIVVALFSFFWRDICARDGFINSRQHDFTVFSDSKRISCFF